MSASIYNKAESSLHASLRLGASRTLVERMVHRILAVVSVSPDDRRAVWNALDSMLGDPDCDLLRVERLLREMVEKVGRLDALKDVLSGRAESVANDVRPYIAGQSVLDLGCGDGAVGSLISSNYAVAAADICDYRTSSARTLPFKLIEDGVPLPYQDNAFDTVMALTVFHHSRDPRLLCSEASRVAKKRVISIESVYAVGITVETLSTPRLAVNGVSAQEGLIDFLELADDDQLAYCAFIDWFYNRVLHDDVQTPYNYNTPDGWSSHFGESGCVEVMRDYLGIDQVSVPEFHVLQVFDPTASA